ncbi:hypothetical protein DFJ73DRAFT_225182 [Zopfochytrium polystomum]|nr:hypothetical protein DFJ73DRAFT_225182 [Zopfochytrium polystomum]
MVQPGGTSAVSPPSQTEAVYRLSPRNYVSDYSPGIDLRGSPVISSKAMLEKFLREADSSSPIVEPSSSSASTPGRSALSGISALFSPFATNSPGGGGFGASSFADPGGLSSRFLASPTPSTPYVGRFQPASVAKTVAVKKKERRIEGGYLARDPPTAAAELNVEPYLDGWAEKIRWWISEKVVKPLVDRIDAVDADLVAQGLDHLTCARAAWTAGMPVAAAMQQAQNSAPAASSSSLSFGGSSLFGGGSKSTGFGASAGARAGGSTATPLLSGFKGGAAGGGLASASASAARGWGRRRRRSRGRCLRWCRRTTRSR